MAKITYLEPIKNVSGKLSKKSKVIYMTRRASTSNKDMLANPNYTSLQGTRSTEYTAEEKARQTRFGNIAKATLTRLNDASKQATDLAAFKAQTQYTTLRQYVWHQVATTIE